MAFTSILRRSASSLAPLATRLVRGQRSYHAAVFTAINHSTLAARKPSLARQNPRYYSKADDSLLRVIDAEIQCAEETDDQEIEEVPSGFPFKIEDEPGYQTVKLTRTYQDEEIEVEVHMPDLVTGEGEDDDDADDDANQSSIPLVVSVSKGSDSPILEFSCNAYPDEIQIESLVVKNPGTAEDQIGYEGPDFHDLDENLQKSFHKYLEIRGIKPSTTNFLHEYMINKDSREYKNWLKKLKQFVQV
ncbi:uncharacterized protein At2g39795, mitochondrial-like [Argentina anserina]|uniref:uncharacterized protein At2g39795, mitochondrial-like n=1 Tax=Argentina anserina TaxID=57926 RepID=UPI0021766536|nr:uncharacterized protein At2g39795, mitochondrial-like [Potentilla anserina]